MTRGRCPPAPLLAALLVASAVGCRATRPPVARAICSRAEAARPQAAICDRDDGLRSLQARFRAEVETSGGKRTAEGVLVWRAPDALRVKLFGVAGLTVYDAIWIGDGEHVSGVVRQPLAGREESFRLGPGDVLDAPEVDLSLVLWSLWRPRCTRSPELVADATFVLDPAPARVVGRAVRIADANVREETLVRRQSRSGTLESVTARYADYDCAATPLPRLVEIDAPSSAWRARVTILEQSRDVTLDEALFALPEATGAHGG